MPNHTEGVKGARERPEVERVLRAARKIHHGPGHYPTHLGGCIGGLSDVHCDCGITDLHFAVMALSGEFGGEHG